MQITDIDLVPVRIPNVPLSEELGIAPYVGGASLERAPETDRFEEALERNREVGTERGATLVRVETDAGVTGWGEAPGSPAAVRDAVEDALVGRNVWEIEAFVGSFVDAGGYGGGELAYAGGVEMALWDALGKEAGVPVHRLLGGKMRESVPLAFCLGLLSPEESRGKAREALDAGFTVLKTKASRYWRTDVARVAAMHDEVDGVLDFRLDPNRMWSFENAVRVGAKLEAAGVHLQYLEQPIETDSFGGLKALRERLTQPVAINEDAYIPHNLFHCIKQEAIDAAVVDLQPSGGLLRTKRLAILGAESNVSFAHHSGHDLGLKNAAKAHLWATTPEFNLAFDSTYYAAEDDVLETRLSIEDGRMIVPDEPGLAGPVDEEKVEEYRTD